VDDDELLRRTAAVLEQGAAGIVYGRNIIQHRDPAGLTRALMAMLHEGATAESARDLVGSA
jgi:DhnA family fructose-bisphosphate aldolase class Ia